MWDRIVEVTRGIPLKGKHFPVLQGLTIQRSLGEGKCLKGTLFSKELFYFNGKELTGGSSS